MGIIKSPEICCFTGLPASDIPTDQDCYDYYIVLSDEKILFKLSSYYDLSNSKFSLKELGILRGEIFNRQWPKKGLMITDDEIKKAISTSSAPRTPQEKLDRLFQEIFNLQIIEGEEFSTKEYLFNPIFYGKLYFENYDECNFYLKTMDELGLIKSVENASKMVIALSITFKGLNYNIELSKAGLTSKNCFIAMSFGKDMKSIRDVIKQAIVETGYNPLIIDEIHIDADKTINDEIIASIKNSKFCISDFTEQKDGVYFEAGFALGMGLKVIYTCHEEWFQKSHFDTNHFPHIIYKDSGDLYQKLKNKINAWVN